ncbi:MAG: response regulator [Bacteroidales bacterium]|nr:response regulator [Bacteroidales bacterium]
MKLRLIPILLMIAGFFMQPAVSARQSFSISSIENTDGLSSNFVKTVHQDKFGFMWFGTKNGLNSFDGINVRRYNCYDSNLRRGNNNVSAIAERNDTLWVGTDCGIYMYDMRRERFSFLDIRSPEGVGPDNWVERIICRPDGTIWMLLPNQGIFRLKNNRMSYYSVTDHNGDKGKLPLCMTMLGDRLYVGSSTQGLYVYDEDSDRFREVGTPEARQQLRPMVICIISQIHEHVLLLGDQSGHLTTYDTLTGELRRLASSQEGKIYLRSCLQTGNELWIGSNAGICIIDLTDGSETLINSDTMGESGLSDNGIYSLYQDREGNIWAATLFGGVNYLQRRGLVFEKYTGGTSERSLSGKLVRGMAVTSDGRIWVGHEDGGFDCINSYTGTLDRGVADIHADLGVLTVKSCGNTIYAGRVRNGMAVLSGDHSRVETLCKDLLGEDNTVYAVHEDSHGNLWVGLEWGLFCRKAGTEEFVRHDEIGYDWINDIYETRSGDLWIATIGSGAYRYTPSTGEYTHFAFDESYSNGLRSNSISAIMEDSKGRIWLSTERGGLSLFNPDTSDFTTFSIEEGLPDNVVYNVLEDKLGFLWFGTSNGLVKFHPETHQIKYFSSRQGEMVSSYNYNSAVVDQDGRFYFGGTGGVITFDPLRDSQPDSLPPLYLTHMRIGNEEISPSSDNSLLSENLLYADKISIPRTGGTIRFSVASPNYSNHRSVEYSYRLLPNDDEWIRVADPRDISFTGLTPGDYTLELRVDSGSLSSTHPYTLSIIPSWYQTWWAYLLYLFILGAFIMSAWRYYRCRQEREMVKRANMMSIRKEKELYQSKIQFFTEIAHEIRTPLSLIGTPLEAIDEIGISDERVKRYLGTIRMNTNRLLDLTSHLLDFQKIDSEQHSLTFANVDVNALVHSVVSRFEPTLSLRDKEFTVEMPVRPVLATIDKEAITKIVSNLLNNAMKYSLRKIALELTVDDNNFRITVSSDGERIEGANRLKIFEPFFQIDTQGHSGGVGIGLPLCSTLAKLHNGSLVLAEEGKFDNTFVLEIPLRQEGVDAEAEPSPTMTEYVMEDESAFEENTVGYSILLVEDNDEMRQFLSEQLSKNFSVETAPNGVEALKMLGEHKFDMIVTDIMMPEMDGYELCCKVKENVDLSNIPVVFLTAKNDIESKVKALKCGGEAYIEKPFSIKYFRQQIMSLLDNRQHERKAFLKKPFFTVDNMKLNKADEEFMNKVISIITENISDENFSVEAMADAFCMSRSSLLRRIKTLFNLSPVELIRLIKLKKAAELIQEGKYRIGDVCFMVGINSSSYFSKLFFKQFGVTPKVFEKQCQKNSNPSMTAKDKLVVRD